MIYEGYEGSEKQIKLNNNPLRQVMYFLCNVDSFISIWITKKAFYCLMNMLYWKQETRTSGYEDNPFSCTCTATS